MVVEQSSSSSTNSSATPLLQILTPTNLGADIHSHYDGDLPFLFKVLSIAKALSIQAHPDKARAQHLHAEFPLIYKDGNHKPEMAIALTPFEAFIDSVRWVASPPICGRIQSWPWLLARWRPLTLRQADTYGESTSPDAISSNKKALKSLFSALMHCDTEVVKDQLDRLVTRLSATPTMATRSTADPLPELICRLFAQFPHDVGCFCALFLNYVTLTPGQAIFLAANEPHAYISGDCVECMATSDNVVRSGLTPKFKDVETLVSMLTYNYGPADAQILHGDVVSGQPYTRLYDPPIDEFSVAQICITKSSNGGDVVENTPGLRGPSIALVTAGEGEVSISDGTMCLAAPRGSIFFIGADTPVKWTLPNSAACDSFVIYRAYCQM
ncbi:mannose-6-phosphate isomerase, class I [Batrachochytrium salamandrivorans]|nr:mannose-6-phosphate isomerase, class I [Batrachochytrium salamandrivorans]